MTTTNSPKTISIRQEVPEILVRRLNVYCASIGEAQRAVVLKAIVAYLEEKGA
jgi:hypothetical protein